MDWLVPLVVFAIYSNASVIAVKFHGVPFIVGAAVPLLLALPIARDVMLRRQPVIVTPAFPFVCAFLAVQFAGTLFAFRPERSMQALIESSTEGVLLYFLVTNAIRSPRVLRQAFVALVASGALVGAVVCFQQATKTYDSTYWGFAQTDESMFDTGEIGAEGKVLQPRLGGHIGEKNRYAQLMALLLPLPIYLLFTTPSPLRKACYAVSLGLVAVGFALAFSRGQAVGIALMFAIMTVCGFFSWRHVALVLAGAGMVALAVPQYSARLVTIFDVASMATQTNGPGVENADGATRGRLTEMAAAGLAFADHPVIGVGPRMFAYHYADYAKVIGGKLERQLRRAHSLYPGLAAAYGTLGLAAYGMILFLTLRDLLRARTRCRERSPELAQLATAMVVVLVLYLTTSIFAHESYIRFYWLLFGVAGATARLGLRESGAGAPIDLGRMLAARA